jgi:KUP system potassium uptake protein
MVDVPFFAANISKILHGAWFPLVIGTAFFTLMLTWARGRRVLDDQLRKMHVAGSSIYRGSGQPSAK